METGIKKKVGFKNGILFFTVIILAFIITSWPIVAKGEELKTRDDLVKHWEKCVVGKKLVWVPVFLGANSCDAWTRIMRMECEGRGMKFEVRDPDGNADVMVQIWNALIREKPAVIVAHNPTAQLLAQQIKRANEAGIFVIQLNLISNTLSDVHVGVNWVQAGRMIAAAACKACGTGSGTSGKVSIIHSETANSASIDFVQGVMEVLNKDKHIKVVSNQAGNWNAPRAYEITAAVIQQHPDLCAVLSNWAGQCIGASQALRAAGKTNVKTFSVSDGLKWDFDSACKGDFTALLGINAPDEGRAIVEHAVFLLQSGLKAGQVKTAAFMRLNWITKEDCDFCNYYNPDKLVGKVKLK